jgi:DNA-3-methyladenine glycosylase II
MAHFPKDPKLEAIVRKTKLARLRPSRNLYASLIEAVASQQLSVKAADTIIGRLKEKFDGEMPPPAALKRMQVPALRKLGFSNAKALYLKEIATFALQGGLDAAKLDALTDDEAVEYLKQIKGIGKWTAEVVLMFDMGRPDVFPADDLGIQKAMIDLYNLRANKRTLLGRMHQIAENWRPKRSLACRYLWAWRRDMMVQKANS